MLHQRQKMFEEVGRPIKLLSIPIPVDRRMAKDKTVDLAGKRSAHGTREMFKEGEEQVMMTYPLSELPNALPIDLFSVAEALGLEDGVAGWKAVEDVFHPYIVQSLG